MERKFVFILFVVLEIAYNGLMNRTEPILCTIHNIVDGQEHQYNDDRYLPDIPVAGVIIPTLDR